VVEGKHDPAGVSPRRPQVPGPEELVEARGTLRPTARIPAQTAERTAGVAGKRWSTARHRRRQKDRSLLTADDGAASRAPTSQARSAQAVIPARQRWLRQAALGMPRQRDQSATPINGNPHEPHASAA